MLAWLPTYFTDSLSLDLAHAAQVRQLAWSAGQGLPDGVLCCCVYFARCQVLPVQLHGGCCHGPTPTPGAFPPGPLPPQVSLLPPIAAIAVSAIAGPSADALIARGVPVVTVRKTAQCLAFLGPAACLLAASTQEGGPLSVGEARASSTHAHAR